MQTSSERIVSWLPRLRRYAHALAGARTQGDAYVCACIEVAREQPIRFSPDDDIGLELFGLFHDIWSVIEDACGVPPPGDTADAHLKRLLAELPGTDRAILLLSAFEGYTAAEIGQIVDLPRDEVARRLAMARDWIRQGAGARILIIEDRPRLAETMSEMVGSLGHTVIGIAAREGEAVEMAAAEPPELLLADIELGVSEDRIETIHRVLGTVTAPVIFVTGAPDFFWNGAGFESAIIVAKPVDKWSLQAAIGQALSTPTPGRTLS